MHECLSVQGWIKAWGDPDRRGRLLARCPECSPHRGNLEDWLAAVEDCAECKVALEAIPIKPEEVVDCPTCMESFEKLHEILDELEHFDPAVASEILQAAELFGRICRLPLAEQIARESLWCSDAAKASENAAVAVAVADRLHEETYDPEWVSDLRAKAHAYLANTYRILGEFRDAECEFLIAELHLRKGVKSGQREARVLSLKASLLIDQARYLEAEALLTRIGDYYQTTDTPVELARTQLQRAIVLAHRDAYREAAEECQNAASNLELESEKRLSLLARQNAVHYFVHAGQIERARGFFDALPPSEETLVMLRRKWIEADLLRAEEKIILAWDAYEETRRGYAAENLYYPMALVALDQSLTAYLMGDSEETAAMAEEASILLVKAAAKHDALAVVRVLLAAVERGVVNQTIIESVRRRVAALEPSH
jgi:hypothetical protein